MKSKLIISSAIAGLVALGAASGVMAEEKKAEKEKCFGIAKKAANEADDCWSRAFGLRELAFVKLFSFEKLLSLAQ